MTERVSDKRLAEFIADNTKPGANTPFGISAALDLRDCRAERDALAAHVERLHDVMKRAREAMMEPHGQWSDVRQNASIVEIREILATTPAPNCAFWSSDEHLDDSIIAMLQHIRTHGFKVRKKP